MADEDEVYEEPVEGEEPEEEAEESAEEQEQRLYAGKFKSEDELERSYLEAQSELTRKSQRLAELERQSGQSYSTQQADSGGDWADQFNSSFYENPLQSSSQLIQAQYAQMRQQEKAARANTKRQLAKYRKDPLYADVCDEFESQLEMIPDNVLADANQVDGVVEMVYNAVAGRHMRTQRSAGGDAVSRDRREQIGSLGVSSPQQSESTSVKRDPTRQEVEMLKDLGLDNDAVKRVKKRYMESEEE